MLKTAFSIGVRSVGGYMNVSDRDLLQTFVNIEMLATELSCYIYEIAPEVSWVF